MVKRWLVTVAISVGTLNVAYGLDTRLNSAPFPDVTDRGNFRILCDFSHASMNDPIVKPGQDGQAHHHFFFGNTKTDAFSTTESLTKTGNSTCQGSTLNRSAYWIPAVYNEQGHARIPDDINIYYKHESDEPAAGIAELPVGLRMIAGNAKGNTEESTNDVFWRCESWPYDGSAPNTSTLPVCSADDKLMMNVSFPNCWNGESLSSSDQSHVAYSRYVYDSASGESLSLCPAGYPVHLPRISYLFFWSHLNESTDGWYLSSDRHNGMSAEPGTTLHGDWWNGWNEKVVRTWTEECLRQSKDCDTGNLGDGTALVREFKAGGGRISKPHMAGAGPFCNGRRATIVGTNGDDVLEGTEGQDVIVAFNGNDIINTYGDKDVICAGGGNDIIDAGDGDDEVRSGAGNDLIVGGTGRDRIYAGSGNDVVQAGADSDTVYGQSGMDELYTDEGHDWAFGGSDNDVITGSYFNDRLYGQAGDDQLYGVGGANLINGGSGTDICDNGGADAISIRNCP